MLLCAAPSGFALCGPYWATGHEWFQSKIPTSDFCSTSYISGTIKGDIVAHERVEIGPRAKIYGNIWTKSIEIKTGAILKVSAPC